MDVTVCLRFVRRNKRIVVLCTVLGLCFCVYQRVHIPCALYDVNEYSRIELPRIRGYKHEVSENMPLCPEVPNNTEASVDVEQRLKDLATDESALKALMPGGTYKPQHCRSRERLAIIVPYRDREKQLKQFLSYMHAFLQKQQIHYTIIVAELVQGTMFNTGLLQNVAFVTADRLDNFTCIIIHDVDLLPQNENNIYKCEDVPRHMVHANSKYNYTLLYPTYFGGAVAIRRDQFVQVNGYSNLYFGWGKQDDDFELRIRHADLKWIRVPRNIGMYYHTELSEKKKDRWNPRNPDRELLFTKAKKRMHCEGLNALRYETKAVEFRETYTWVMIDMNMQEIQQEYAGLLSHLSLQVENIKRHVPLTYS